MPDIKEEGSSSSSSSSPILNEPKLVRRINPIIPLTSFDNTPQNIACISFLLGCLAFGSFYSSISWALCILRSYFDQGNNTNNQDISVRCLSLASAINRSAINEDGGSGSGGYLIKKFLLALVSPQVGLYALFWSIFHLLEFVTTATYNPLKVKVDSFLLNNGAVYHYAHLFAISEFILEDIFLPKKWLFYKHLPQLILPGIFLTIIGQTARSKAMITASTNFSHTISYSKEKNHTLVTHGIYQYSRHPSYFGFFWWVFGLQLILSNPLSFPILVGVTWNYFHTRIRDEEVTLFEFFGDEYKQFKKQVSTKIPFIH